MLSTHARRLIAKGLDHFGYRIAPRLPRDTADTWAMRKFYGHNGYQIFRQVFPLDAIGDVQDRVITEVMPCKADLLRHPSFKREDNAFAQDAKSGKQMITNSLVDPHLEPQLPRFSRALLNMVCTNKIADLLMAIDGERVHTIHQIIFFFLAPGTDLHVDGWALDTDPPGGIHTLWIPFERVNLRNGPICIVPWQRGNFVTPEALGMTELQANPKYYSLYHERLVQMIRDLNVPYVLPEFDAGDMVAFTSLTPHGTLPMATYTSRMAMQVIVRPSNMLWSNFAARHRGQPPQGDPDSTVEINERWRMVAMPRH